MSSDLRQFLKRFESTALEAARSGKALQLESKLSEYEQLLRCWLEVAPRETAASRPYLLLDTSPRFVGPLEVDLYDIVRAAGRSRDVETYEVAVKSVVNSIVLARDTDRVRLYQEMCRLLAFGYFVGARDSTLNETATRVLDNSLHSILSSFGSRHAWERASDDERRTTFQQERPYLDAALALVLQILSTAMEEGQQKAADYFMFRLIDHRRDMNRQWEPGQRAPAEETSDTLHDYAVMAIGAWALHLLESQYRDSASAAREVLAAAHEYLPARHDLIALWELYRGGDQIRTEIDTRLKIERWDLRDKGDFRVGVTNVRWGGGEWIPHGFFAFLLLAEQPSDWELQDFFSSAPSRYLWEPSQSENALKQLASSPFLDVPQERRDVAIQDCMALLRSRRTVADASYLVHIATSPLDEELCERLRRDVLKHFDERRDWIRVLRELGATKEPARYATPVSLRMGLYIPRDYLISGNSWASGFGEYVGRDASTWESVLLVGLAMTSVPRTKSLKSLTDIGTRIREACVELASTGATPNLVVLPSQTRFAGALFEKPLWQVEDRAEVPHIGYGKWDELTVLKAPFIDADTILVADGARLFGTVGEKATQVEVVISDSSKQSLQQFAESARAGGVLPESGDVRVLVEVVGRPLLGISQPMAGVGIDVRDSDACYAMEPDSDLYHRPSCDDLEGADDVRYSLARHLPEEHKDRKACAKCKPERWDAEGRRGRLVSGEAESQ